jgi:hypothetical protein
MFLNETEGIPILLRVDVQQFWSLTTKRGTPLAL